MKLNLGCGNHKLDGYVNCDIASACNPDRIVDLEQTPWPFEANVAEEVVLSHVLEHIGERTATYLAVIKELYRVCADGACKFCQANPPGLLPSWQAWAHPGTRRSLKAPFCSTHRA